jgi:Spy/CpxP family protein refolding chaperone
MNETKLSRKAVGFAAALVAAMLAAGTAFAQMGPGAGAGPHGQPILRALRAGLAQVDLSDQQKADIKALFESKKPAFLALRVEMQADRAALKAASEAATPDPAAVGKAFLKVKADGQAAKAQFETTRDELKALLTPEQWTKLQGFMSGLRHGRRIAW